MLKTMNDQTHPSERKPHHRPIPPGLETMAPGAVLGLILATIDVTKVSGYDQIVLLRAHQRMAAHYQAATYQDMAAVKTTMETAEPYAMPSVRAAESTAAEVRAALHLTRYAADIELSFALVLECRMPRLLDLLAVGAVDVKRAKVIERATMHVSDVEAQAVVDQIADEAPTMTTGELRARVATLCMETGQEEAKDRYDSAVADRRVIIEPTDAGTANLYALDLPPDEAMAIKNRIHAAAKSLHGTEGETRTMDQIRADIFVDYLSGNSRGPAAQANVEVTVTMNTLLGLNDEPGDLAGFGPVIADVARRIANDEEGKLRVIICDDSTAEPTHIVTPSRQPSAAQRRRVQTRHRTCVFPGCRMPSKVCDIDHTVAVADGGQTCDCNLAALCRHDHCIKHEYGWNYERLPDGSWQWTTRLGHTYTRGASGPSRAPP